MTRKPKSTSRKSRGRRRGRAAGRAKPSRFRSVVRLLLLIGLLTGAGYVAWLDLTVRTQFEGRRWELPARIFARPLELYPGMALSAKALEAELVSSGYHRSKRLDRPGNFRRRASSVELKTRAFTFWDGREDTREVRVDFASGRVATLAQG